MRKITLFVCLCCTLFSCENIEKKAAERLHTAQVAFEAGQYNEAKLHIDSVKLLYPKAFEARRAALYLMQDVELAEQKKTLVFLDSMLTLKKEAFEKCRKQFAFEKDAEYQQIGNYLHPSQVIEKNLNRSFLRFMVDERGTMNMTSIYCGNNNIHHTVIKVTAPDGTFAQTPHSKDSYETENLGRKIEKADYKMGEDGGVMGFIYINREKPLKIEYIGDRRYSTSMSQSDRKAVESLYELSQLLSSMTQIKQEQEEAQQKIDFINKKILQRKDNKEKHN